VDSLSDTSAIFYSFLISTC